MEQVTYCGLYGAVKLPDEDGCFETELHFEILDDNCISQSVRTIFDGRHAGFALRIFRDDNDAPFLEMTTCSETETILDLSTEDLGGIKSVVSNTSRKYDLADKAPGCEVRPYFRH